MNQSLQNLNSRVLAFGFVGLILQFNALPARSQSCWDAVSTKYQLNRDLLMAIAKQESNFKNHVVNTNSNGSRDVCMMQINSSWFPTLKKFNITEQSLRQDPCLCLDTGAWILRQNIDRMGLTWQAVGAYNAVDPAKRTKYAWSIYKHVQSLTQTQ
jgi:soluble lytic murein transglycosylase-like protein